MVLYNLLPLSQDKFTSSGDVLRNYRYSHYYINMLLSRFQTNLSSRFWNRDNEAGTKGPDPLVPGEITGTKGHV